MQSTSGAARAMRGSPRSRVNLSTAVFSNHFYCPVEVSCTDLSASGMFLAADLLLGAGERITVSFTVPGTWHRITTDAMVVRAPRGVPSGMGLRFDRLPSLDGSILSAALAKHRVSDAS